ncbi:ATPase [Flavobacterium pectinovorum]|uniref:ATPase n=1 Tax=Flavobacterium pectinovorum TaxID=29533 RepID=A0A502EQP6_9FLAO|nr:ATPase [Flavobacterium pectinovorum]
MMFVIKKKIQKKLKEFKLNYSSVRFYNGQQPVVYVNLKHRTKVRTYLNLFFRIRNVYDEPIVLKFSVLRMLFLAKWFKELDYLYFEKPFSKLEKLKTFSHSKKDDFVVNFGYKKVYTTDDYQENVLPYIMHPINYLQPEVQVLPKNIGIIMSGNFDKKIYDTKTIEDNFGLLNRWRIYQEVLKHDKLKLVSGDEVIKNLNSGIFNENLILMKWQSGAIPADKWRTYLSSAHFILCAPGMTMPMCHNLLEAMSVGVIPILNYSNWLNPSLKNDVNCLVYQEISDILPIIDKALSLPLEVKTEMANNALKYYKEYYENYSFNVNSELVVLNENINDLK